MPSPRLSTFHVGLFTAFGLLAPSAVSAQEAGFAISVAPSPEYYEMPAVSARLFGMTREPAASFVRGCPGYVTGDGAGAVLDVEPGFDRLAFSAVGEGVKAMVVASPDGLYSCALADDRGLVSQDLARPAAGRYQVWAAAGEAVMLDARLIVSPAPVSAVEIFGLDLARLGPARVGDVVFAATADARQELAIGAPLHAEESMEPLSTEYCAGFSRLDAPDLRLTVSESQERISIFATSTRDLTLAVVAPDGSVACNDDAFQLNPAVTLQSPEAGDYLIFVGGFSEGAGDYFDLFAALGAPSFGSEMIDPQAPPRNARVMLDPSLARQGGQAIGTAMLSAFQPMEMMGGEAFCPGFTDLSAPDYVVALDADQPRLSLSAQSDVDLVLAVHTPLGQWLCNDDFNGLNPAVQIEGAMAGDYAVYVGAYMQYSDGTYALRAALGDPVFGNDPVGGGTQLPFSADAPPLLGSIGFAPDTLIDPRIIFDIRASNNDVFGMGEGCAGYIDPTAPDVVIDLAGALEQMMIYMVSDADGALAVIGPDGTLHCNDDFEMLNPGILFDAPMAGAYRVFAGTYGGASARATLGVTRGSPLWAMDSLQ